MSFAVWDTRDPRDALVFSLRRRRCDLVEAKEGVVIAAHQLRALTLVPQQLSNFQYNKDNMGALASVLDPRELEQSRLINDADEDKHNRAMIVSYVFRM